MSSKITTKQETEKEGAFYLKDYLGKSEKILYTANWFYAYVYKLKLEVIAEIWSINQQSVSPILAENSFNPIRNTWYS